MLLTKFIHQSRPSTFQLSPAVKSVASLTFKGFKRSFHNPDSGYFSTPFLSFHCATACSLGSERARNLQKMHLGLMSPSLSPRVSEYPLQSCCSEVSVHSPRGQLGETCLLRVSEEGEAGSRWEQAPRQHPENNQKRGWRVCVWKVRGQGWILEKNTKNSKQNTTSYSASSKKASSVQCVSDASAPMGMESAASLTQIFFF